MAGNRPDRRLPKRTVGGITPEGFVEIPAVPETIPRLEAGHPTRHGNIAHPNTTHGERPAMLPSMKVGRAKQPTPFVRTIVKPSGKRR